jgi:hypothetical protein
VHDFIGLEAYLESENGFERYLIAALISSAFAVVVRMLTLLLLTAMLTFGVGQAVAGTTSESQCNSHGDMEAVKLLINRLQKDRFYKTTAKMDCMQFVIPSCDALTADIDVHEKHNQQCGGDPNTWPRADAFRVHKKTQKIEWYNVVEGDYLDYAKAQSLRKH